MKQHTKEEKVSKKPRRSVLKMIWISLGFIAIAEFIAVCITFFRPIKKHISSKNPDGIIDAGAVDEYEPGSVSAFVRGRFYLVHLEKGGFLAISSKCPHLGCTVPWDKENNRFACPCHASEFDITGKVMSSPAPRAMDVYKIEITNNRIFVDTEKRIQRKSFEKEQIVYPDTIKTIDTDS